METDLISFEIREISVVGAIAGSERSLHCTEKSQMAIKKTMNAECNREESVGVMSQ